MKKVTFLTTAIALFAFLALPLGMWGQSDYSTDYTGNVTLSTAGGSNASACKVIISGTQYDGIKAGTSGKVGAVQITVPANTKYLHLHVSAWNGENSTGLAVTPEGYSEDITLTSNSGISGNSPFTFSGDPSTSDYYKVITFTDALDEETNLLFTATGGKRFVVWGVTSEEDGSSVAVATPTFTPTNGTTFGDEGLEVSIACTTEGAIIYYTTDGEVPTNESTEYTAALTITETTIVKAIAYVGEEASAVATATYTYVDPNAPGTLNNPYTVAEARAAIDAGTGVSGVYATGIVSEIVEAYSTQFNNVTFKMVDEEGDEDFLEAYRCVGELAPEVAVGDVVVVYGNLIYYNNGSLYEFAQGCQVVSLTHPVAPAVPSVTVTPSTVNAPAEGSDGTLSIAYENIPELISFDMYFCDANGDALEEDPDWILAEIQEENDTYSVDYVIDANEGEARTAYFKVYTFAGDELEEVYAIVTVNQEAYVAPSVATLPFAFNGGRADIEGTDGLTQKGLGTDYNANTNPTTKLKFDGTGDWMILHFNEIPGTLSFDIKGNSFSGGTFTVQTSEDGVTYTELAAYTELGEVETKTFDNLDENVRYIKWIYTEKSSGNVGLGNIHLYEVGGGPVIPASITVTPDTLNVDAGQHLVNYFSLTYENIVADSAKSFTVHYYNAEGEEIQLVPGEVWMMAGVVKPNDVYQVLCVITANEGEARTAYFKVSALDAENNTVYSNLVTVNQAEYVAPQASITFDPDFLIMDAELHYDGVLLFTYENIIVENLQSFGIQFYTAEGEETVMPQWFFAMVTPQTSGSDEYQVNCATLANEGEARSVYFKVYAFDADSIPVYSNLVTVTQTAPVYDYAVLPFEWEGGERSAFEALNGTTTYGVGDYAATQGIYRMKLDTDGDYIMVKTDSQPGQVTIGVKMVGGSNTSTITIQGSADGENFTDIDTLTISGAQNDILTLETTNVFDGNDRYVRMLFTKGSNVGVGPITITKGNAPSITLTPDTFDLEAVGSLNGMHLTSMMVSYHNFEITQASDFNYQFYNAEGEEQERPEWVMHSEVSSIDNGYQAICIVTTNNGPARSAYFKVYAFDADSIPVYSNLVTINQAGVAQQYTLTVEPFENLELITFVNNEMVMEGDGEIQVNEGDTIMLSVVADEGYVMETLMVNGVNHVNDIAEDFTYTFDMPAENVTISATAMEYVAPVGGNYVRITSLDQLTDGSKVIIAARYDEEHTNGYYAMPGETSGKPTGVAFSSETSGDDEILPEAITSSDSTYYWTVNVTDNGYTFTNANNQMIGYTSGTNFATGGNNTVWTITRETAEETAMVAEYTGFVIRNGNTNTRAFAFNGTAFGAYATSNMGGNYNFFLDFFVQSEAPVTETYTLEIAGYVNSANPDGGYYLIASPVTVNPENVPGMTEGNFDLYYFDESSTYGEWINYEVQPFNLVPGKGYLYAHDTDVTLTLTGTPYNGDGEIELTFNEGAEFEGWNLVGNPFGVQAEISDEYYVMNEDGDEIIPGETYLVEPMQGVFVIAEEVGETVIFEPVTTTPTVEKIVMNVSRNRGNVMDRAIVCFGEGGMLPKFQLNPNSTKIYIPQGENDYAVVRSGNEGEMPVSFKAAENGTYTLCVNAENMEMDYLHLIDNMTGADIDLLQTPSYSFEANISDNTSRFTLVFAVTDGMNENITEPFAFFNGSEWVVSNMGKATLQVVDVMGRVLSTEAIDGNAQISISQMPGVYMLRLVNGDNVKVQKVVVR